MNIPKQTVNFSFVCNCATPLVVLRILSVLDEASYLCFSRIRGCDDFDILEGVVVFKTKQRVAAVAKKFSSSVHVKTRPFGFTCEAVENCKARGVFIEFGCPPAFEYRTVFDRFREWVLLSREEHGRAPTVEELASSWPKLYLRYKLDLYSLAESIHS